MRARSLFAAHAIDVDADAFPSGSLVMAEPPLRAGQIVMVRPPTVDDRETPPVRAVVEETPFGDLIVRPI